MSIGMKYQNNVNLVLVIVIRIIHINSNSHIVNINFKLLFIVKYLDFYKFIK